MKQWDRWTKQEDNTQYRNPQPGHLADYLYPSANLGRECIKLQNFFRLCVYDVQKATLSLHLQAHYCRFACKRTIIGNEHG